MTYAGASNVPAKTILNISPRSPSTSEPHLKTKSLKAKTIPHLYLPLSLHLPSLTLISTTHRCRNHHQAPTSAKTTTKHRYRYHRQNNHSASTITPASGISLRRSSKIKSIERGREIPID